MRFGIIGIGNIGSAHAVSLLEGKVTGGELAAICDLSAERKEWAAAHCPGVPFFETDDAFFDQAQVDTVIIATPHYFHPTLAKSAFEKGWNVLTEKPAGVRVSDVRNMIAAADRSHKQFGIMWNQRTNPLYQEVKRLVDEGILGEPLTLHWVVTDWYRDQAYYDSCSWRATWAGEGGGVLMNQAPHQLDLLQWIFGMPNEVKASCEAAKYHRIEVEDEATLDLLYQNGRKAHFFTSTGIKNGINRLVITGPKGELVAEGGQLTVTRGGKVTETHFNGCGTQHLGILNDYTAAARESRQLLADGHDGLPEIILCNAAYLSAWTNQTVSLPLDCERFDTLLAERIAGSVKKTGTDIHTDGHYEARWQHQ